MPTENPRILTTLEPPLYKAVSHLARREGVPLSQMVRDMLKEALELIEDAGWESIAEKRRKTPGKWISHHRIKQQLKIR